MPKKCMTLDFKKGAGVKYNYWTCTTCNINCNFIRTSQHNKTFLFTLILHLYKYRGMLRMQRRMSLRTSTKVIFKRSRAFLGMLLLRKKRILQDSKL